MKRGAAAGRRPGGHRETHRQHKMVKGINAQKWADGFVGRAVAAAAQRAHQRFMDQLTERRRKGAAAAPSAAEQHRMAMDDITGRLMRHLMLQRAPTPSLADYRRAAARAKHVVSLVGC